jgi:purine-cytosine permease-like protein
MIIDPIFLPQVGAFIFVFAIVLGLLTTAKLFNKNVNAALAAVFGLFSAIYEPFVSGIQAYLPIAAAILIVIFFFVLINRLFETKEGKKRDVFPLSIVVAFLLIILGSQWSRLQGFLPANIDPSTVLWIVGILLVIIIFWAAYAHQKTP